ncbi:MAG: hypothetical protein QM680_08195 [Luteolibacter sp.]
MSSAEKRARFQRAVSRMTDEAEREFPLLKIEFRPVPEDQNGFLQLYRFTGKYDTSDPVFAELKGFTGKNRSSWEVEKAKLWLQENAAIVEEIERIAMLKDRSLSGDPPGYVGFIKASMVKSAADVMMVKARLAAEEKDEKLSILYIGAAQNLASHLREIEAPTLLLETVVIGIDRDICQTVFKNLLPSFGRDADLAKWRSVLAVRNYNTEECSKVIRGEWFMMSRFFFPPLLVQGSDELPDPGSFLKYYASLVYDRMSWLEGASLAQLQDLEILDEGKIREVSKKGQEILKVSAMGVEAWKKGYCTAVSKMAKYRAALDLLILEKEYPEWSATDMALKATHEPLSAKPFVFDAVKRRLSPPPEFAGEMEEIDLPW